MPLNYEPKPNNNEVIFFYLNLYKSLPFPSIYALLNSSSLMKQKKKNCYHERVC